MLNKQFYLNSILELCTILDCKEPEESVLVAWYNIMQNVSEKQFRIMLENMQCAPKVTLQTMLKSMPKYDNERSFREYLLHNQEEEKPVFKPNIEEVKKPIPFLNEYGIECYDESHVKRYISYLYRKAGGSFNCLSEEEKYEVGRLEYLVTYMNIQLNILKEKGPEGLDQYYIRCQNFREKAHKNNIFAIADLIEEIEV